MLIKFKHVLTVKKNQVSWFLVISDDLVLGDFMIMPIFFLGNRKMFVAVTFLDFFLTSQYIALTFSSSILSKY